MDMNGNNDSRGVARELFPRAMQSGITAAVLIAMLFGAYSKAIHAADTFQKAVLIAESGAIALSNPGPSRNQLRSSPGSGISTAISFSDQFASRTSDRRYGAALRVAADEITFWSLSAGANDAESCGNRDGRFLCLNRRLVSSGGMERAASTPGASGYMVVAAANLSARAPVAGVRYTDTPGHQVSDVVSGNSALASPVSEPKIYTMMLAGLGLMGFVASRRQA
jgi:PEP-CTERM motif